MSEVRPRGDPSPAASAAQAPVGAVFAALADPTRRHVVSLLSERPSVTASALAAELPISRQAIAKHLAALVDARLLVAAHHGRETRYRLTPQPLDDAARWLAQTGARWDERLARLGHALDSGDG
ncbi:MAG: ArsR/SmtB family transcription factor [Solirubrobacteraceae bacterium]